MLAILISLSAATCIFAQDSGAEAKQELYQESLRPKFHFTAKNDYINDPNGLFFFNNQYHLFFQTGGIKAKRWGHAVSGDLLHWKQLEDAIAPKDGHPAFSGCAVIDHKNTSGFASEDAQHPPIVAVFTSWGEGQALAYSLDAGESWQRYSGNPVMTDPQDSLRSFPLSPRDPHVMWDENQSRWVMVLYDNLNTELKKGVSGDKQGGFSIFTSKNLKEWTRRSHLSGFYVCPDVFKLPIETTKKESWVAMDWSQYTTGSFDGSKFTPAAKITKLDFGSRDTLSANQTWKNLPDGRTIQICWIRGGKYPGMPFTQQLSFPTTLSLREVNGELKLCKQPIEEIESLYENERVAKETEVEPGRSLTLAAGTHSFDLALKVAIPEGGKLEFEILGQQVVLTHNGVQCSGRTVELTQSLRRVRILADATSIEVFANSGLATLTFTTLPPELPKPVVFLAADKKVTLSAIMNDVQSIWEK